MEKKINWKTLSIALGIVLLQFFVMLIIDEKWKSESVLRTSVFAFISLIQTTAIAVAAWEFIAKKEFAKEMLDLVDISSNIGQTGVEHVYSDFQDIDWSSFLEDVQILKVAVSYAYTWRHSNRTFLQRIGQSSNGTTFKVFLPDYNQEHVVNNLALRFNMTTDTMKEKIESACTEFQEYGATVFLYNGFFQTSYYLTNKEAIMAMFNHQTKPSKVPAVRVNNSGSLYRFINDELEEIEKMSNEKQ